MSNIDKMAKAEETNLIYGNSPKPTKEDVGITNPGVLVLDKGEPTVYPLYFYHSDNLNSELKNKFVILNPNTDERVKMENILYTVDNKRGVFLEEHLNQLVKEMRAKSKKIESDDCEASKNYLVTNDVIIQLLSRASSVQYDAIKFAKKVNEGGEHEVVNLSPTAIEINLLITSINRKLRTLADAEATSLNIRQFSYLCKVKESLTELLTIESNIDNFDKLTEHMADMPKPVTVGQYLTENPEVTIFEELNLFSASLDRYEDKFESLSKFAIDKLSDEKLTDSITKALDHSGISISHAEENFHAIVNKVLTK